MGDSGGQTKVTAGAAADRRTAVRGAPRYSGRDHAACCRHGLREGSWPSRRLCLYVGREMSTGAVGAIQAQVLAQGKSPDQMYDDRGHLEQLVARLREELDAANAQGWADLACIANSHAGGVVGVVALAKPAPVGEIT